MGSGAGAANYTLPSTSAVADKGPAVTPVTQITGRNAGMATVSNPNPETNGTTQRNALIMAAVGGVGAGYFGYKIKGPAVGVVAAAVVFFGVNKILGEMK